MSCYLYALESQNLDDIKLALPFCDKKFYGNIGLRPFHYISLFKSEADVVEIFDYLVGVGVKWTPLAKSTDIRCYMIKFIQKSLLLPKDILNTKKLLTVVWISV